MTKLKFNLTTIDPCGISIQDVTGFVSGSNTEGFVAEGAGSIPVDSYKISNGYFKTVVLYEKYGVEPIIINPFEEFVHIPTGEVDPVYANNFPDQEYLFSQDGVFTIKRIFIISEEFYQAESSGSRFDDKSVYYTDGATIYKVVDDEPIVVSVAEFITNVDPYVGMITNITIVSTCFINQCYFNLINTLIEKGLEICSTDKVAALMQSRDFLYMVLEAIKYLKEQGNTIEIQRIIESTNTCGAVCDSVSKSNDCGCNG